MSTNKTQNYTLHSWSLSDDFQLSEINQNFAALDAALAPKVEIIVGAYKGDGNNNRLISLGRTPVAVHIERAGGQRDLNSCYGGLFPVEADGNVNPAEDGFVLRWGSTLNSKGTSFVYMAFFAA